MFKNLKKVIFFVAIFFPWFVILKLKWNTFEKEKDILYDRSIERIPCTLLLRSILNVCERLRVEPSGSVLEQSLGSIYFRKRDGPTNFKMLSIGATNLLKNCENREVNEFNFLFEEEKYIALIKNFVKKPYIAFVAKPGNDIAVSGKALLEQLPWDKHLTSILYYIMEKQTECNVIDVGGYIGITITLPALGIGCKVITFELQGSLRKMISESAVINGYRDRLSLYGPISSESREVCFYPNSKHFAWIRSFGQQNPTFKERYNAKIDYNKRECHHTTRLDKVLDFERVQKIQLMKLDVDGPDLDVLISLGEWLHNKSILNIFVEMDINEDTDKPIFDLLKSNGYSCMQLCYFDNGTMEDYQRLIENIRRTQSSNKNGLFSPECKQNADAWCWLD
tara:strand:- start:278 stop:1459 length:1182 start_codon:yes stop_codon:yes gene_type:complete